MSDRHATIYVDDSGNETVGASLSALIVPTERWTTYLGWWTKLREELLERHGLPKHYEIHSVTFLSGSPLKDIERGARKQAERMSPRDNDPILATVALARAQVELSDTSLDMAISAAHAAGKAVRDIAAAARLPAQDVRDRLSRRSLESLREVRCLRPDQGGLRRQIYDRLLNQIASFPEAAVLTVIAKRADGAARSAVYARLLDVVNEWLVAQHRYGTVIVDGTPSARTLYYREAHRALDLQARRIIEDEVLRNSTESHFIQMADICAHTAHNARSGETRRYLQLAPVLHTSTGRPPSPDALGFFEATT